MTTEPWIQAFLDKAAAEHRQAVADQGVFTLGQMRDALKMAPGDWLVKFDDGTVPVNIHSYRGVYAYPAIEPRERSAAPETFVTELDELSDPFEMNMAGYGTYTPGHTELVIAQPVTVAEMLIALDLTDGAEFEGYKGGQFRMDSESPMFVAEYGSSSNGRHVCNMRAAEGCIILDTDIEDWAK